MQPKRQLGDGSKTFLETNVPQAKTKRAYADTLTSFSVHAKLFGVALGLKHCPLDLARSIDKALVEWSDQEFFEGHPAS